MSNLKFLSRGKLTQYLDDELRHILNDYQLYEIDHYGWLENGKPDPDYIGHAFWQDSPPKLPKLSAIGEEFTNLMRSARHSLGLISLYYDEDLTIFDDNSCCFSFHLSDTVNKLNLATDRVREFLITAFVRQSPRENRTWLATGKMHRGDGFYKNFHHPFQQIKEEIDSWPEGSDQLRKCLERLQPLAEKVAQYRTDNQNPVRHLSYFQERFTAVATNLALGYPDEALADSMNNEEDRSLLEGLRNWYQTLIETSNLVFLAEHLLRQLAREIGGMRGRSPRQQIM